MPLSFPLPQTIACADAMTVTDTRRAMAGTDTTLPAATRTTTVATTMTATMTTTIPAASRISRVDQWIDLRWYARRQQHGAGRQGQDPLKLRHDRLSSSSFITPKLSVY
jgi:hypothetical protein